MRLEPGDWPGSQLYLLLFNHHDPTKRFPPSRSDVAGTLIPRADPHASALLGGAGLRHSSALRHGDGGRHISSGNDIAIAGAKTVEGGLCAAFAAAQGWALWREPQSAAALLSVSSHS